MLEVNTDDIKEEISREVDRLSERLIKVSKYIYDNPELGYKEYRSSKILTDYLNEAGFFVESNIAGMETAFSAVYPKESSGHSLAVLAEYDALEGLGHGCGHNLIAAAGIGAAIALKNRMKEFKGQIVVFGCPAEEAGVEGAGGKINLVESGCFKDIDAVVMFHPAPRTTVGGKTTALAGVEFNFSGKAAHSAGNPWDGINALDGVLQTFNSINALRQHLRDNIRIHGIITKGGSAPNIVPEFASAFFFIRDDNSRLLKDTIKRVEDCAKGAALATGATLEIKRVTNLYDSMNTNHTLAEILEKNLNRLNLKIEGKKKGKGSTDFGNVTQAVPGCELAIRLGSGAVPHTRKFLEASDTKEGYDVMCLAAKVMAFSMADLFYNPALLEEAKKEFKKSNNI